MIRAGRPVSVEPRLVVATFALVAWAEMGPAPSIAESIASAEETEEPAPTAPLLQGEWEPAAVTLRDLPGTEGEWQEGAATIRAPRVEVLGWLTDVEAWPRRFADVAWTRSLEPDEHGRRRVQLHSRSADADLTLALEVSPELVRIEGIARFARTEARIHLVELDGNRTRVLFQVSAQPRGLARIFTSRRARRARSFEVARVHLETLDLLAYRREQALADDKRSF